MVVSSIGLTHRRQELLVQHGLNQRSHPLVRSKQDPASQHGASQPHGTAPPQALDAIIVNDTLERLHDARTLHALRARLQRIKRLRGEHDDRARDGAVRKRRRRRLRDVPQPLKVLEDIVRAQPHGRRGRLFQRRRHIAPVQRPQHAVLLDQRRGRVPGRLEPPIVPRVVDQRRLDPLRRRDRERARHDARGNARHEIAQGRQRARLGVLERVLDAVERYEPDAVLQHGARHERLAAFVQRPRPFFLDHPFNHAKRVPCRTVVVQLDSRFGKFERCIAQIVLG